jgi:hypothetical protein
MQEVREDKLSLKFKKIYNKRDAPQIVIKKHLMFSPFPKIVKLIPSYRALPVYYVDTADLVRIQDRKIFTKGLYASDEDFDFETYDSQITNRGWPDPLSRLAKVRPNMEATKPGIEIMCNRKLFEQNGSFFYMLMESKGIDSIEKALQPKITRTRVKTRREMDKFLETQVYAFAKNHSDYQERLLKVIADTIRNPQNLFELHILGEKRAEWVPWNSEFMQNAHKSKVIIDMDWLLANKLLALYAIE